MLRVRCFMNTNFFTSEYEEQSVGLISERNMEAQAEHRKLKYYQTFYTFTTSVGVGIVGVVLFWILYFRGGFAWHSNPGILFNWHPLLMVIGMFFLHSQSLLIYRTGRNYQKKPVKYLHAILHLIAFILSVIALVAVFDSHNLRNVPNLYTLHSWIGLSTVIVFSAQFLFGFITFLYPGLSYSLKQAILPLHVCFGTGCFIAATITATSGFLEIAIFALDKTYSTFLPEGILINFLGVCVAVYGILVVYMVNEVGYKRLNIDDDQVTLDRSE